MVNVSRSRNNFLLGIITLAFLGLGVVSSYLPISEAASAIENIDNLAWNVHAANEDRQANSQYSSLGSVTSNSLCSTGIFAAQPVLSSEPSASDDPSVACPAQITHSSSLTVVAGQTVVCTPQGVPAHNEASFYRAFSMSAFGVLTTEAYNITSVEVGVDSNAAGTGTTQPITVRLYAKTGAAFPSGFPNVGTQIGSVNLNLVDGIYTLNVPITATVPAGTSQLIMEVFAPSGIAAGHLFQMGGNSQPETGPSYIRAPACGSSSPVTTASIGFPAAHYIMAVNGFCTAATPTPTATPTNTPTATPTATPAGSLIVTNANDSGAGSLRQVVADANAAAGANTIIFDPTFFNVPRTITLTTGDIVFANSTNSDATVVGPGSGLLTVSGNNASKIFSINETPVVSISGMTLTGGNGVGVSPGNGFGGAVYNQGDLTLTNVLVTGNTALIDGGGVYNSTSDTLTVINSTISNNTADFDNTGSGNGGGGLYSTTSGVMTITGSTISGNSTGASTDFGGGGVASFGTTTMTNSTVSGNNCGQEGGGVYVGNGTYSVSSSTIVNNTSSTSGGGVWINSSDIFNLNNTIIANNTATTSGPDAFGTIASQGFNLIEITTGSTITGTTATNIIGQDPSLGPLQDNSGSTFTHALSAGSPAKDKGASGTADQRQQTRPVDDPNIVNVAGGNGADIGSFEVQPSVQFNSATYNVDEGVGSATISVERLNGTDGVDTVQFATSNGTATGGSACTGGVDFINTSGALMFGAGVASQSFNITICDDAQIKGNETVNLAVSNPVGVTLGTPAAAVLTISNNDTPTPTPTNTPTATPTATPTVTPTPAGSEGDVAPRPDGDGSMLSTDVTQLRRFVSGLDTPNPATNENQRADCAPRTTSGDGTLTSGDVVQGRRYVAGLDPLTPSGGPTAPLSGPEGLAAIFDDVYSYLFGRELRVGEAIVNKSTVTVPIELTPHGDEVAVSFTLEYDDTILTNARIVLGEAAPYDSTLTVNSTELDRIGILIDSNRSMTASAMPVSIVYVTFDVVTKTEREAAITLTDSLAVRSVSDGQANALSVKYRDGVVKLNVMP